MHEVIPAFAAKVASRQLLLSTRQQMLDALHEHGINARYLARVRSLLPEKERLRDMMLVEMQIRCMKKV